MLATTVLLALVCLNLSLVNGLNLSSGSCGQQRTTSVAPDWRIVGGSNTVKGEFPWQIIMIRRYFDEDNEANMMELCGGTILNEQWVLTAAHCVMKSSIASEYMIYFGVHDINAVQTGSEGVSAHVDKIIHHPSFNQYTIHNDVALIKIKGKLDFKGDNSDLEPVCLATSTMTLPTSCVATGFGYRSAAGLQTRILQKVSEPVVTASHCTRVHQSFQSATNVCAGGTANGGTGTCMGDSGGPLQCKATDGKYYQVGITSYGIPCAHASQPDVFTRVAAFTDWIKSTIDSH